MSRNERERESVEVGMNELSDGNRIMESFESIGLIQESIIRSEGTTVPHVSIKCTVLT